MRLSLIQTTTTTTTELLPGRHVRPKIPRKQRSNLSRNERILRRCCSIRYSPETFLRVVTQLNVLPHRSQHDPPRQSETERGKKLDDEKFRERVRTVLIARDLQCFSREPEEILYILGEKKWYVRSAGGDHDRRPKKKESTEKETPESQPTRSCR